MSFPGRNTILEVVGPGNVELTAEVITSAESGVTVEWGGDAPEPGPGQASWPGERGLLVLPVTISGEGRYGLLEATVEPEVVQRREAVRVQLAVAVSRLDSNRGEQAQTVNISSTGLLVSGELGLAVGDTGMLCIALPDNPHDPLCAEGRVLHNNEPGLMGMELLGLKAGQQARLAHVVFEQQRVLLRRRHTEKTELRVVQGGKQ